MKKKGKWMLNCNKTHSNERKCGWNLTHTTGFHDRWKDDTDAYLAMLPEQHAFYCKVTRPFDNGAKKAAPAQATTGTNAAIKERFLATRVVFNDMAKMASDPTMAVAMEKLTAFLGRIFNGAQPTTLVWLCSQFPNPSSISFGQSDD